MTDPVTAHPIDTEALRKQHAHLVEKYGPEAWAESRAHVVLSLLEALAAAEHRATRAEAQSAIRGRAVVIYRERARETEAERDEWRQTALEERAAALDALEQIKVRDARVAEEKHLRMKATAAATKADAQLKAVRELHAEVEGLHCHTVCSHRSCLDDSGDQHHYPCPTIRTLTDP